MGVGSLWKDDAGCGPFALWAVKVCGVEHMERLLNFYSNYGWSVHGMRGYGKDGRRSMIVFVRPFNDAEARAAYEREWSTRADEIAALTPAPPPPEPKPIDKPKPVPTGQIVAAGKTLPPIKKTLTLPMPPSK